MWRMETNQYEEPKSDINPSNEGTPNEIEDTKPRRISNQPIDAAPVSSEESLESTSPSLISRGDEQAAASVEETRPFQADLESIAHGHEQTIPPPAMAQPLDAQADPDFGGRLQPIHTGATTAQKTKLRKQKTGVAKGSPAKKAWRRPPDWLLIPALGLLGILLIAIISAFGGYASGIELRRGAERTQAAQVADQQFQLGLEDMVQGNYYRARQRFEYVIQLAPGYPGATDKLAETLLYLNATATPTLQPTPTITPTPDVRANEELFNQANQALLDKNWDQAIEALLSLRKKDAAYRAVEVDGMLFLALRNRGWDKIVKANLESGIYDLSLAANFGPLDSEAQGLRNWAQLYITGASFWGIDWAQVVEYFSQVAPQMPNLMDGSGMTASERYRIALFEYGNTLAQQGQFCRAVELYQQSLSIAPDPQVQQALEQAAKGCQQGQPEATQKPGKKPKNTPTP
jgi:tetratricopeptide (TPR) repeat protein